MITSGSILIAGNAPRPPCVQVEDHAFPDGWVSVAHNLPPHELEKDLVAAGWTFFYVASAIKTTAFGFDRTKMIRAALQRVITSVSLQRCNCLEIDAVSTHSFLGLPYVSMTAHSRHIQKGATFSGQ
jgi:hypothetical protein